MRRALQPAVIDLPIKFDMPPSFEVYQAPEEIPTLFSGDKIVVYGIMKRQKKSTSDQSFRASVNGTATLTGQVLSRAIQFKLTFEIPPPSDFQSAVEMPIVHQLASKALIRELQSREDWTAAATYEQRKKGIVNLSIESGVISPHTAYIALDEEQEKLIEGAVKIWDIVTTTAQYRRNMSPHIPTRSHHFGSTESTFSPARPLIGASQRRQFSSYAQRLNPRPRSLSATSCGSTESMLSPTSLRELSRRSQTSKAFTPSSSKKLATSDLSTNSMANISDMYCELESVSIPSMSERLPPDRKKDSTDILGASIHSELNFAQDDEVRYSRFTQARYSIVRPGPESPVARHFAQPVSLARKREQSTVNQVARPRDNLEFLIFLQKFEGFWDLDTLQWLDLPVLLKIDNIQVCATVYALAYMKIKFPSRRDEWELVARKAEAWLERQMLPDQVNLEELRKEASDNIIKNLVK